MDSHTCDFCGNTATKKCAGCEKVYYCSREHQQQAWSEHRPPCKIYQTATVRKKAGIPSIADELVDMEEHKAGEAVRTMIDGLPYSTGSLLLFLSILGCEPMDQRFFKRASEHTLVKIMNGAKKIPEPLMPFIAMTNDKWNERTFRNALSLLVALGFVTIADDNDDVFSVNSSTRGCILRTVDSETKRIVTSYATFLVGTTMLPDQQSTSPSTVSNVAAHCAQMDACRNHCRAMMPELKEDTKEWEFWSTAVLNLARAYRELGNFVVAKELFLLSIGSGKGSKHWQAKFDLALMEGVDMNEWLDAEDRLREAVNQGLLRPETTTACLNTLLEIITSWSVEGKDKESEVEHLKGLAKLIVDGMENQGHSLDPPIVHLQLFM